MPHTLLLADDSVTIQRVIELTFADEDIVVVAVSDGDEAIAALTETPPDIVLADIGMPGRTGYEVAQHIKETPRLSHIPVLLLTGAFEPVDQSRAAEVGCDGVLSKPFEPQLVVGRVKELLAKPKRAPSEPATTLTFPQPVRAPAPVRAAIEIDEPSVTPVPARAFAPPHTPSGPASSPRTAPTLGRTATPPSTPLAPQAPVEFSAPAATAAAKIELDSYFDRLDQAFAGFSGGSSPPAAAANESIDWFGTTQAPPTTPALDLPTSDASDSPAVTEPEPEPEPMAEPAAHAVLPSSSVATPVAAAAAMPVPVAPSAGSAPLPPLAEAFAALLAAEQSAPEPSSAPEWPARPSKAVVPITDDLVEAVTQQVLSRWPDQALRESVAEIVSSTAERLIKQEIERIKRSLA